MTSKRNMSLTTFNEHFYVENCVIYHRTDKKQNRSGSVAGHYNKGGYLIIALDNIKYVGHRILYQFYRHIELLDPSVVIDHVDGNTKNNSSSNLRVATLSQNSCNTVVRKDCKTKIKGLSVVSLHKNTKNEKKYWRGRIELENKVIKLFPFTDEGKKQAIEWLVSTRLKLHGEFAKD